MSKVRVVSLNGLCERLAGVLGRDSLLFARFEQALRTEDEELLDQAMRLLASYPAATREAVQNAMLAWLFDAGDASGLEALEPASRAVH